MHTASSVPRYQTAANPGQWLAWTSIGGAVQTDVGSALILEDMLRIRLDGAIAELFAGLRDLLRDIFFRLGAERRALRRLEFQAMLEYGRANGLDADGLAAYARATGNARAAGALARLAPRPPRLSANANAPHKR